MANQQVNVNHRIVRLKKHVERSTTMFSTGVQEVSAVPVDGL